MSVSSHFAITFAHVFFHDSNSKYGLLAPMVTLAKNEKVVAKKSIRFQTCNNQIGVSGATGRATFVVGALAAVVLGAEVGVASVDAPTYLPGGPASRHDPTEAVRSRAYQGTQCSVGQ